APVSGTISPALALSVDQGLEAPRAGTAIIGNPNPSTTPASQTTAISIVSDVTYQSQLPQIQQLNPNTPPQTGTSLLSAKTLDDAGLANLNLNANLTISMDNDVSLNLQPGGSFFAQARRIDVEGGINVPSGTIDLIIAQNITSYFDPNGNPQTATYADLTNLGGERIVLGAGSSLDVSGQTINLSTGNASPGPSLTVGGQINILDETAQG